jgi:hypothetical protein
VNGLGKAGGATRRIGRVLDANGQPVEGAIVAIVSGTAPTPEIGIRTGPQGRFMVALPAGTFQLQARADFGVGGAEVEGGVGDEILIRLDQRKN